MYAHKMFFVPVLVLALAIGGCSDDSDRDASDDNNTVVDVGPVDDGGQQDGGEEDGGQQDGGQEDGGQEDGGQQDGGQQDGGEEDGGQEDSGGDWEHRCGDAPLQDWPLHQETTDAQVSSGTDSGVTTFEIDANAGGSQDAADNPFVYVSLATNERVDIDDHQSLESDQWDLAFKRFIIRTNSADSGPGDVAVAKVSDTSFADVSSAPSDSGEYAQDISYTDQCDPILDPIGTLYTAFNHLNDDNPTGSASWYEYGPAGVSPVDGDVYIIDVPERSVTYKLEIGAWDDGVFTIHVAEL
jgi:hypothetical protein